MEAWSGWTPVPCRVAVAALACLSLCCSASPTSPGEGAGGTVGTGTGGTSSRPGPSPLDDPCELPGMDCSKSPPNVLFILMDDVGLDLVSTYGLASDAPPTPNLDALAARGLRFESAYAQAWCSPTRADILTGRNSPKDFQMGRAIRAEDPGEVSLPLEAVTLPEALDAGSRWDWGHAHIGKWHLTKLADNPADAPLRHGYQRFRGAIANPYERHTLDGVPQDYYNWERSVEGVVERTEVYATTQMVDDAIEVAGELPQPWFLWLAPFAAHDPHQPPPAHLHSYGDLSSADAPTLVRAMVEALDSEIGRLLASLAPGVLENTVVIVMGDNGSVSGVSTVTWRGRPTKGTVYEGGIHVPLVIAGPLVTNPGRTYSGLVHARDIFSTVLDIAGVRRSARPAQNDSVSLLPHLLDSSTPSGRRFVSVETYEPNGPGPYSTYQITAFDGRFKLIRDQVQGEQFFDMTGTLFEGVPLPLDDLTSEQDSAYLALGAEILAQQ